MLVADRPDHLLVIQQRMPSLSVHGTSSIYSHSRSKSKHDLIVDVVGSGHNLTHPGNSSEVEEEVWLSLYASSSICCTESAPLTYGVIFQHVIGKLGRFTRCFIAT